MAGLLGIIVDEHISKSLVKALQERGFTALRVVDVLGQGTEDPDILEYAAAHGHVWLCRDEKAMGHIKRADRGRQADAGRGDVVAALPPRDVDR